MVKLNPNSRKTELLKELEDRKEKAQKELDEMEKKLEEAVSEFSEDEIEEQEGENREEEQARKELESLEEALEEQRRELEGNVEYEIEREDLENLPELYNQVKQDIQEGRVLSQNVQNAMDMIYSLNKAREQPMYVAQDAHNIVRRDEQDAQYVNRLESLFDQLDKQTNVYKS